jgi:hypothetical protein
MQMTGHKTRPVFDRYDIVSDAQIRQKPPSMVSAVVSATNGLSLDYALLRGEATATSRAARTGLKIRASERHPATPLCKALQIS